MTFLDHDDMCHLSHRSKGKSRKQLCANPKRVSPYQRGSLTRDTTKLKKGERRTCCSLHLQHHSAADVMSLTKNQITKKKVGLGNRGADDSICTIIVQLGCFLYQSPPTFLDDFPLKQLIQKKKLTEKNVKYKYFMMMVRWRLLKIKSIANDYFPIFLEHKEL